MINVKLDALYHDHREHTSHDHQYGCQALHVLVQYFLVCNYFWMFCEGLYLHTLLVVAFVSEEKILKWFYAMGWGIPLIIIIIYASFRGSSETDTVLWVLFYSSLFSSHPMMSIIPLIDYFVTTWFEENHKSTFWKMVQLIHKKECLKNWCIQFPSLSFSYIIDWTCHADTTKAVGSKTVNTRRSPQFLFAFQSWYVRLCASTPLTITDLILMIQRNF